MQTELTIQDSDNGVISFWSAGDGSVLIETWSNNKRTVVEVGLAEMHQIIDFLRREAEIYGVVKNAD